jgi:hypothetical protein
MMIIS